MGELFEFEASLLPSNATLNPDNFSWSHGRGDVNNPEGTASGSSLYSPNITEAGYYWVKVVYVTCSEQIVDHLIFFTVQ